MVKQLVSGTNQSQFLERFYEFSDSLIRSVTLRFASDGSKVLDLLFGARDSQATDGEGWVSVMISVDQVLEMGVLERRGTTIQVLSHGIHLVTFDGAVGIEFGGAVDSPRALEELRQSDAFALGESISFEVFPY